MKKRKSPKADLERQRFTLLSTGLLFACALVLTAFEWRSPVETFQAAPPLADEVLIFEPEEIIPSPPKPPNSPTRPKPPHINERLLPADIENFTPVEEPASPEEPVIFEIPPAPEEVSEEPVDFERISRLPSFPGGDEAFRKYLNESLIFPDILRKAGIRGKVIVAFTVQVNGTISDIEVVRSPDPLFSAEAVRVVEEMPVWIPALNNGIRVPVRMKLPISFSISD